MKPNCPSFDPMYIRWRAKFAKFESRYFEALCNFIRKHFDNLLDRYYLEGHESMDDFLMWAFERYLRETERGSAKENLR